MTGRGRPRNDEAGPARRLTLTPISFDIVIALHQLPEGLRLSPLAHAIGSPVSSVQAALRILVATDLAVRVDATPPTYRLAIEHPAHEHLVRLGLVLPDPGHVVGILLRANPAVEFAAVDPAGFIAGVAADAENAGRLTGALDDIRAARDDVPPVEIIDHAELTRHLTVSIGLRDRVRGAIVLKGRVPRSSAGSSARPAKARTRQLVT